MFYLWVLIFPEALRMFNSKNIKAFFGDISILIEFTTWFHQLLCLFFEGLHMIFQETLLKAYLIVSSMFFACALHHKILNAPFLIDIGWINHQLQIWVRMNVGANSMILVVLIDVLIVKLSNACEMAVHL